MYNLIKKEYEEMKEDYGKLFFSFEEVEELENYSINELTEKLQSNLQVANPDLYIFIESLVLEIENNWTELQIDISKLERNQEGDLYKEDLQSFKDLEDFYREESNFLPVKFLNDNDFLNEWIWNELDIMEVTENFYNNVMLDFEITL